MCVCVCVEGCVCVCVCFKGRKEGKGVSVMEEGRVSGKDGGVRKKEEERVCVRDCVRVWRERGREREGED